MASSVPEVLRHTERLPRLPGSCFILNNPVFYILQQNQFIPRQNQFNKPKPVDRLARNEKYEVKKEYTKLSGSGFILNKHQNIYRNKNT